MPGFHLVPCGPADLTESVVETMGTEKEYSLGDAEYGEDTNTSNLKTRNGIVLMPQPSDDPVDPLNWSVCPLSTLLDNSIERASLICHRSSFHKHMAMITIAWLAFFCYCAVTSLVPGTLELAKAFHVPKTTAVYLGNTPVALYAVGPFLWSPLSHFTGRRPVLLVSNVIAIVGAVVAASAHSYASCMVGRVILGLGGSAFWCLGPASIGDIVSQTPFPHPIA